MGIKELRNFINKLLKGEEIPKRALPYQYIKERATVATEVVRTWYESVREETQRNCRYWKLSVWI